MGMPRGLRRLRGDGDAKETKDAEDAKEAEEAEDAKDTKDTEETEETEESWGTEETKGVGIPVGRPQPSPPSYPLSSESSASLVSSESQVF